MEQNPTTLKQHPTNKVVGVVPVKQIATILLLSALPLPINVRDFLLAPTKMDTNKIQKNALVVLVCVLKQIFIVNLFHQNVQQILISYQVMLH